jgi:hypothetical protein
MAAYRKQAGLRKRHLIELLRYFKRLVALIDESVKLL